jgi:hypothetical protein
MSEIQRASYRKPTGSFSRSLAGVAIILKVRINDSLAASVKELLQAATAITQQLGVPATGGAAHRIGLPEALYMVLERCGDHEAARLACESFLETHQPDPHAAPAFGEYRAFVIEPNTATGDGWIVLDGERNMMPNGESFESVANARAAVDLLYEHGMIITADFLAECAGLIVQPAVRA